MAIRTIFLGTVGWMLTLVGALTVGGIWAILEFLPFSFLEELSLTSSTALAIVLFAVSSVVFWFAQASGGHSREKQSDEAGGARWGQLLSIEFMGEVILLAATGVFFYYMLSQSRDWGLGAQLLPWIAISFGLPLWVWRVVSLFRTGLTEQGSIMDTGFLETEDSGIVVAWRWVMLLGTTAGLLFGVWVLGFHVAIPLYTILYLIILGKVRWYWTVPAAAFFLAVIIFIYGQLLLAEWNIPHWVSLFNLEDWWSDRFDPDNTLLLLLAFVVGVGIMTIVAFGIDLLTRMVRKS